MPAITLKEAEAALTALKGARYGEILANNHILAKHFSKIKAHAAVKKLHEERKFPHPQSYFKKSESINVNKKSVWDVLSEKKKNFVLRKIGAKPKNVKQMLEALANSQDGTGVIVEKTFKAGTEEATPGNMFNAILTHVIKNAMFYKSTDGAESVFIAAAPLPDGYVGREIDLTGQKKREDIDHAVVVVDASTAGNPRVVTMYPVTRDYLARQEVLT